MPKKYYQQWSENWSRQSRYIRDEEAAMKKVKEWISHSDKTIIYVSHNPELIACADKEIKLT